METSDDRVAAVVLKQLSELGVTNPEAQLDSLLISLLMDDDLTYEFLPVVQEMLGVRVPNDAWDNIYTPRDLIRLLQEHCTRD